LKFTEEQETRRYRAFFLNNARVLEETSKLQKDRSDAFFLKTLEKLWKAKKERPSDEYLCIVDKDSRLILHTDQPYTVGNYVGDNSISGDMDTSVKKLSHLVKSQKSYVGDYISSSGQEQLAAFVPIPKKGWTLGIHRSKAVVENELGKSTYALKIGFLVICLFFIPFSILTLYLSFRSVDKMYRKVAEDLRKNEETYRLLIKNLPSIVFRGHIDWSVEFFDDKVKWSDIVVEEDIETMKKSFIQALKTDRSYKREYRIRSKAGDINWIRERSQIVFDDNGAVEYINGIFFDISDRKRSDEEKKKLEAQLRQSQKMEAIGTLAGGISHDFNNLLTAIIGNAQLALMNIKPNSLLYENIKEIKRAGDSAASLTRQLLAFSRKQVIQPKDLDFNQEIRRMEKMIRRMIGEDVEFLTALEPELWKVHVDPGQMDQVIMNLVVNARDAMRQGGKITVRTANIDLDRGYFQYYGVEEQPGPYVMLSITDTGIGMDDLTKSRIFEPFFTTKGKRQGTGLGLSTVYGIVKQSNGYVWVYSEPGKGTTFKIYFPGKEWDVRSEEKEQIPIEDLQGSETVLVVEDDDRVRSLVQKGLQKYGYRILEARNGEDALKKSEAHRESIHLVLTDVVMPGMSGKEVANRLQSVRKDIKVIYMSGYFDDAISRHGVLEAEVIFIEKPFQLDTLARKIRGVLEQ